jgi:hypothetical protein
MTEKTALYLALIHKALALPYHYRSGTESRARRVYRSMSLVERAYVDAQWL